MKPVCMKWICVVSLLVLSFFLSGFVVDFQPQTIPENEGGSDMAVQLNNRGVKLFEERKFSAALASFLTASQMDRTLWQFHFNCAVALVAMGRLEEALSHLELSMDIDPDNPLAVKFYKDLRKKVNGAA